jgi:hypothetical protein
MTVIDKRGKLLDTCFGELSIGDVFQGTDDRMYIKVGNEHAIRYHDNIDGGTWAFVAYDYAELIIPLKATLVVERRDN